MLKRVFVAMLAIVLAISFASLTFAQDKKAAKDDKMAMSKTEKEMGPLKSVSCDPACGFMCRSHSEKELTSIVKQHALKAHKMKMDDKQIKDMMKTEDAVK